MTSSAQHILLVEDNEDDYMIVRDLLDDIAETEKVARIEVEWVTTYEAACAALMMGEYDVCLLDYRLGGHTGLEILQELPADNRTPIIVLTGNEDHSDDVAAAKAGAADYLVKGHINAPLLERSIRYAIQHKQSELATAQAQRFAQATVDALSAYVAVLDEYGNIVATNAVWRGFAHDNCYIGAGVGTNYLMICEISANQDAKSVAQGIREVMAGCEKFCLDYPCDLSAKPCWFRMSATRFAGDGPPHIVVAHEDITERKLHEQQLLIHSQLLKNVGQAVIVTDREGVVSYWNDSAEKIYGWSSAEALSRNVMQLMPTDLNVHQAENIMARLTAGQSWSGEFVAQKKDGASFPIYATNTPILNEVDYVTGIIGVSTDITERKTVEEQLRLSEANLAAAQQIAHVGSWVRPLHDLKNFDTNPLFWSDEVFRIFGYEPGAIEVSYQTFINGVHPDDRAAAETMLSAALLKGQKYDIEHRVVRPDGTERIVHELSHLVLDENGQPVQMVGTVQDITERKQIEEELRRSQVHHRAIVQSALDALVSMDHEGRIIEWNPAAETMFGHEREFALGQHLADLIIPPALRDQHRKGLENYLQTGVGKLLNRRVEMSALRADGSEFPVELTIARHALEGPPKFSSYIRDITERKQAASAMARLATIVESSGDAIISKTLDGIITTWNASAETLYGYSVEEAIGSSIAKLLTPDDPEEETLLLAKIAQGQKVVDHETVRVRKDGSRVDVSMTLSPLKNELGEIIGASAISRDISDRKRAENALRASEERYHNIVANTPGTVYQFLYRPDGSVEIPFVNEACRELLEMEPAELQNNPTFPADIIHPDDRAEEERAVLESMQNLTPFNREWRIQLPSGKTKWVHGAARPRRMPDGGVLWDGLLTDITIRKEAEAERDRFFTLSLDMLAIVDFAGYAKRLNPAFITTLGYTEAELAIIPLIKLVHPDDLETTLISRQGLTEGTAIDNLVNRYRSKNGNWHWLEWKSVAVDGVIYAAARDITERKDAENALRASEERFQGIVANAPGLVYQFALHPDGSVEWPFVSEGCRDLYEIEPTAIQLNPNLPLELIHPADRAAFDRSMAVSRRTLLPWKWEGRLQLASGKISWVEGAARPQRLANGGTLWDGLLMDSTARKEAEAERDRFFTLSLDMLTIIGSDGYFKRLNPAFETTLGFSGAELMAAPFTEWVHPDDQAATREAAAMLESGLSITNLQNRYCCRDGSYKWLRWVCAPFGDLWYCAAHDITAIRKAETALLKANDELELHVMERTAELATANESLRVENVQHQMTMGALRQAAESLQQAKMEADAANLAKSEFLSRMSHELRTPLNAILGFGQLLEMRSDDAKQLEGIEQILKAGRHLLDLINEVLDIARIEAGHLSLSLEAISIANVLGEVLDLTRPLATLRQISLSAEADPFSEWHVLADQQRLKQVLINLLSNAIKYNHEGGSVDVSCQPFPGIAVLHNGIQCEGVLRISVRDTGGGLSDSEMAKLFQPFERLGAAHTQIEGTGIGLVLCQRLVEAMQGTVGVESEVGQGSTFWAELPLVSRLPLRITPPKAASGATFKAFLPSADKSGTILYIEDNLSNLTLVEQALSESNHQVRLLAAIQGSVGLELAALHAPDLILLDLHLPDMMGDMVLRLLKADVATRDIPVVILSADATPGQIKSVLASGAADYLTKPLDLHRFFELIDQLMHKAN